MTRNIFRILLAIAALSFTVAAHAQVTVTKKGKAKSAITLADDTQNTLKAAELMQDFVKRISGAELPITEKGNIVIGGKASDDVGEDGFSIDSENGHLTIRTGGDKGAIYGVVTLLEKYMGVSYWAYETYDLTETPDIVLPEIHIKETPAFRYRQSQNYGLQDPIFKMWYRYESPGEEFIDNMWVHTFNRILP